MSDLSQMNFPAGTNEPDIVAAETGRVFVAKSPEVFTYDADGNLLQDGRFNYACPPTWKNNTTARSALRCEDFENRLIGVETREGALPGNVPRIKVEFAYDYMSRRISKKVYARDSGSWLLTSVSSFLYDAWNLVREETTASGTGKIVDEYIWGLDLSGSLQGAGGIGGLLSRQRSEERYYDGQGKLIICHHPPRNPEQPKTIRINENIWPLHEAHGDTLGACEGPNVTNSTFFYTYDGNGNVSELLQSSVVGPPSSVAAHYEYSPFGEMLVSTGSEAADNPFRFSTKYWDNEIGLYYYGYRYYSASLGRWLAKDPIGISDRELLLGHISPRDYTKQASVSFNDIPKDILDKIIDPSTVIQQESTAGFNVQQYANLYSYVLNSPMQHVDTDGRSAISVGGVVIVVTITVGVIIWAGIDVLCVGAYEQDYRYREGQKLLGVCNPKDNDDPLATKVRNFCKALGKYHQVNPYQPPH